MNKFTPLDKFVVRRPRYDYLDVKLDISEFIREPSFREAIYIASKTLYDQLLKYLEGKLNEKDNRRMEQTLLKYLSRMMFRCTPFGEFSICGTGKYYDGSNIKSDPDDIEYSIVIDCVDIENIRKRIFNIISDEEFDQLQVIINETIRKHEDICTMLCKDNSGEVCQSVISNSSLLNFIIKRTRSVISVRQLGILLSEHFDADSSILRKYIKDLIRKGVLISNFNLEQLSFKTMNSLLATLLRYCSDDGLRESILKIIDIFKGESSSLSSNQIIPIFEKTEKIIKSINQTDKCRHLHLDTYLRTPVNIPSQALKEIMDLLQVSEYLDFNNSDPLANFKQSYKIKYENKDMPLLDVLDEFIGIGFDANYTRQNKFPTLIKKDRNRNIISRNKVLSLSSFERIVLDKIKCMKGDFHSQIILTSEDFKSGCELDLQKKQEMPKTFSCMYKIIGNNNNGPILSDVQFVGPSASNMLTRFAIDNASIRNIVSSIIQSEESNDCISAELFHIANIEYGNVQRKSDNIRKYKINYLSLPSSEGDYIIDLKDLYLSLINDEIRLYSKKLKKRIIPCLSSAYNPNFKSSPLYRFFNALRYQGIQNSRNFSINNLMNIFDFIPRIRYNNIVLSPATWLINTDLLKNSKGILNGEKFTEMSKAKQMARYLMYKKADNYIVVDINSKIQVRILINEIKSEKMIALTEFLPMSDDFSHYSSIYEIIQPIKNMR